MNEILEVLTGGDLRSEGRADEVAALVIADPDRLPDLAEGLALEDRLLRARTCMSLEVISRTHPGLLEPLRPDLIRIAERETVAQARWHLAEIFGNVPLDPDQTARLVPVLLGYLDDRSRIVVYCAVQALGVLGRESPRRDEIAAAIRSRAGISKSMERAVAQAFERLGLGDSG
jgi:hypothetical protein